jgi:hypothetical protein
MLSIMIQTGMRPGKIMNALIVALFGAGTDDTEAENGRFLGALTSKNYWDIP